MNRIKKYSISSTFVYFSYILYRKILIDFFRYSNNLKDNKKVDFGARFFIRDYLAIVLTSVVRHFLISREFRTSPRDVFV